MESLKASGGCPEILGPRFENLWYTLYLLDPKYNIGIFSAVLLYRQCIIFLKSPNFLLLNQVLPQRF